MLTYVPNMNHICPNTWRDGYYISISACGVMEVRVQVFGKEYYIYIYTLKLS